MFIRLFARWRFVLLHCFWGSRLCGMRSGGIKCLGRFFSLLVLFWVLLIEARDLNEAIQVAAKTPMASRGTIEVRPIREIRL